jgi:hypothetical protein
MLFFVLAADILSLAAGIYLISVPFLTIGLLLTFAAILIIWEIKKHKDSSFD